MRVELEPRGNHSVVRMTGMVTAGDGSQALHEALEHGENDRPGSIVIDAAELRHLDSTALGELVGSMRRLHAAGREICLVQPGQRIVLLLQLTHLDALFPTYATVADALAALQRRTDSGGAALGDRSRRDV
jgi:anti-anti-sigma factor